MSKRNYRLKPLEEITHEKIVEEVREEIKEKMLKNASPEKMPNFANLDSYSGFVNDNEIEVESDGEVFEMDFSSTQDTEKKTDQKKESNPENEEKTKIKNSGDTYVELDAPKPKKKTGNFDNLKVFNKMKEEIKNLKEKIDSSDEELEDTKKQLDLAISEKNSLLEKISELEKTTEKIKDMVDRKEFDKIRNENEELILRNSELELELSISKEKMGKEACKKASQEHVYSKPGYSKVPEISDTRPAMNGYQDWI